MHPVNCHFSCFAVGKLPGFVSGLDWVMALSPRDIWLAYTGRDKSPAEIAAMA